MAASRRVRRRRRRVAVVGGLIVGALVIGLVLATQGSRPPAPTRHRRSGAAVPTGRALAAARIGPGWRGDGAPVTITVGGDVHFEGPLGRDLANDPATALGAPVHALFGGADISMADFESALTDGTCPSPQPTPYVFFAPPDALTALRDGGIGVVSQANNHAADCGAAMMRTGLAEAAHADYPVVGIGTDAADAYEPDRVTVDGQRVALLAATAIFDPAPAAAAAASAHGPGVASAIDEQALLSAVEAARRTSDTVVVYVTWGTDGQMCPDRQQVPLAAALVRAGADIVVGSGAHVQQGAGYLGRALVDYGLGNLAFYDSEAPEAYSGTLAITVTGRHIDRYAWRPAVITDGVPAAQSGPPAAAAVRRWQGLRGCTGLAPAAGSPVATARTESSPAAAAGAPAPAGTPAPTGAATTTAPAN